MGIIERGLLIGGRQVKRVHGAAYGEGVYVANWNYPRLALSFAKTSQDLILCIVLSSAMVRSHRDAQLVQNKEHVIPVFLATRDPKSTHAMHAICQKSGFVADCATRTMELCELVTAGVDVKTLKRVGYPVVALRDFFGAEVLVKSGYGVHEMQEAGFSANELAE